ncbi:MAG: MurT ligase domain-containing protein [Collinsella sp.]|nr:MurT ligase domain-containing protein [Collinsella sp.]
MSTNASTGRSPRFYMALAAGKMAATALKAARRNGGQVPGTVAEAICPDFLARVPKPGKTVFVTGTNGKTTTSNLLDDILLANGFDLVTNRAGGNIITGIESSLIKGASLSGSPRNEVACMELDELSCRRVLPHMHPDILLVVNLYRDNFTRNANPDYIFGVIDASVPEGTHLILNADDLISCRLAPQATHRTYFSIDHMPGDLEGPEGIVCDLTACPECGGHLEYEWCHLRHLGKARCASCGFENPAPDYLVTEVDVDGHSFTVRELCHEVDGVAPEYAYHIGTYSITNLYNLLAALVAARELGVPATDLQRTLASGEVNITAARFSEIEQGGIRLVNTASKGENSTATSTALATICREPGPKVVALMLADYYLATNPKKTEYTGWYYQADFEYLADPQIKQVIVQGANSDDLLLRLLLAGIDPDRIKLAATETEAADMVELDGVEGVFCAYDIFNGEQADRFRARVVERIEARA